VPDEFETHHAIMYRVQTTLLNAMALTARILGKIKLGVEPILFRNYLKVLNIYKLFSFNKNNIFEILAFL